MIHVDNLCSIQADLYISTDVSNLPSNAATMFAALSVHTNNGPVNVVDSTRNSVLKNSWVSPAV